MFSSEQRKRAAALLFAAVLLFACLVLPASAAELPAPSSEFYVNDLSGVLSAENKAYIVETNVKLNAQTGAQVVVVTVKTLKGADLNQFATDLFRAYGIGDRERNNGVLLLVVTGDRDVRIEVGYGLEGAINDAKAGRLLDEYVVPYLAEDQWDEGIVNGFNAIVEEIKTEYGLSGALESNAPVRYEKQEPKFYEKYGGQAAIAMGIGLLIGILSGAAIRKGGFLINLLWLVAVFVFFITHHTLAGAIAAVIGSGIWQLIGYAAASPDTGGSSGGSYRSGGGYSGSGGSHSYSGGGGSSGGGGASRKF